MCRKVKMPSNLVALMCKLCNKVFHAVTVDQMRRHIEKSHHGVTFEELHLDFQCRICMEPERSVSGGYPVSFTG